MVKRCLIAAFLALAVVVVAGVCSKIPNAGACRTATDSGAALEDRLRAVRELSDLAMMAYVATAADHAVVREAAIERLGAEHQALLADLAKNKDEHPRVRLAAAKKLLDTSRWVWAQIAFADIAKNGGAPDLRTTAIAYLTNQAVLLELAQADANPDVRYCAASGLNTQHQAVAQAVFVDLAQTANDSHMRFVAACQLDKFHQDVAWAVFVDLAIGALKSPDMGFRYTAALQLIKRDQAAAQAVLAEMAKHDNDAGCRRLAIEHLTDPALLADVAQHGDAPDARRLAAVKTLTDSAALADLAKHDADPHVRATAIGVLTDQAVLADVAKHDPDWRIRQAATERLTDQTTLADLVKNDKAYYVRQTAAENLTDQTLLADLAKNDKDGNIRRAATNRLAALQTAEAE